jgi:hypothetical protein
MERKINLKGWRKPMKVLKSGVEMTPKELEKIKGGGCACGCNARGFQLWTSSQSSGACFCNCYDSGTQFDLNGQGGWDASSYI